MHLPMYFDTYKIFNSRPKEEPKDQAHEPPVDRENIFTQTFSDFMRTIHRRTNAHKMSFVDALKGKLLK